MPLAGRCECGVALELVAQDPEPHLPCRGERRCVRCSEVKPLIKGFAKAGFGRRTMCRVCCRPYQAAWGRMKRRRDARFRREEAERTKLWRVHGPKTGKRKGPMPRPRPAERECIVCHVVYPDMQFVTGKRRRLKCYKCFREIENRRERERRNPNRQEQAA